MNLTDRNLLHTSKKDQLWWKRKQRKHLLWHAAWCILISVTVIYYLFTYAKQMMTFHAFHYAIDRSAVTSRFWLTLVTYSFGLYHLTVTPPIISLKIHPYLELLQFSQVAKFTQQFQVQFTFTYAVSQWESKMQKKKTSIKASNSNISFIWQLLHCFI